VSEPDAELAPEGQKELTEPLIHEVDPEKLIPLEAARAHLRHWWREPLTGLCALGIGVYDSWFYGHDKGLSSSLDEILVIGGIVLMAGSRRLFAGQPTLINGKENKKAPK
jgi:hypothetical protein